MKFASYVHRGKASFGAVMGDGVVDVSGRLPGIKTLADALAAGALPRLADLASGMTAHAALDEIEFLPPIPQPRTIAGVGLNYAAHAAEAGRQVDREAPVVFFRLPASIVGHGAPIRRPRASHQYDFEGELAVVIGRGGRHIAAADAMGHIAGYTCFMDGSVRDFQKRSLPAGKNFERSGACGPYLVTADAVPDISSLELNTHLNGARMQHAPLSDLIHSIPDLIAFISAIVSLSPGDIIATGTPAGVGVARQPQLWLKPDDVVTVDIPGVGTLTNRVVAE